MIYILAAVAVVISLTGSVPFILAARRRKRRADAEKIAKIADEAYRKLREAMQAFIDSGAIPRYTDHDWLEIMMGNISDKPKDVIYYKDNKSAFDSACEFMDTGLKELKIIPAIVERAAPTADGLQMCQLNLASADGGTPIMFCTTVNSRIPKLQVGDW